MLWLIIGKVIFYFVYLLAGLGVEVINKQPDLFGNLQRFILCSRTVQQGKHPGFLLIKLRIVLKAIFNLVLHLRREP